MLGEAPPQQTDQECPGRGGRTGGGGGGGGGKQCASLFSYLCIPFLTSSLLRPSCSLLRFFKPGRVLNGPTHSGPPPSIPNVRHPLTLFLLRNRLCWRFSHSCRRRTDRRRQRSYLPVADGRGAQRINYKRAVSLSATATSRWARVVSACVCCRWWHRRRKRRMQRRQRRRLLLRQFWKLELLRHRADPDRPLHVSLRSHAAAGGVAAVARNTTPPLLPPPSRQGPRMKREAKKERWTDGQRASSGGPPPPPAPAMAGRNKVRACEAPSVLQPPPHPTPPNPHLRGLQDANPSQYSSTRLGSFDQPECLRQASRPQQWSPSAPPLERPPQPPSQ